MDKNKGNKKNSQPSIRGKTFAYLFGFCFILLIVLWLFQTVFLDSFYKSIKTRKVKRDAESIAQQINSQNVQELFKTITDKGDIYVEIWLPGSQVKLSMGEYPEENQTLTMHERLELFSKAEENGGSVTQYYSGQNRAYGRKQENIQHARIVQSEDTFALLLVSTSLFPVDSTVQTLRVQLWVISVIMIILSAGLAWIISRQVSKPIAELNKSAKKLGEGDYTVVFDSDGYREIQELSETLTHTTHELSKMDVLRQELVANVSHDLRTPLTLITGYSEMMRDYPEESSGENLQVIVDESKRLTSLVSDLLDLSKLQAGMHEPKPEIFNLTELTEDIINRFSKFREHDNYQITFEKSENVLVYADPARISQVIYNLIGNAINYTGDDKQVHIRQIHQDGRVWLEIIDTGVGLSQEARENVWNRYYREEGNHKRAITGSGLGLSIVQTILEQHPGVEYGILSEEGKGSTFWFSLPIMEEK